jgi:tyrosyl-tRNA synthetase
MKEIPENLLARVNSELDLLQRGAAEIYSLDELRLRLAESYQTNKPLRIKLGMDPTAPDIHLGHTVVMRKMRQFQDLGHTAVLIIGDYTARIGDPSGQNKTRPVLSPDEIDRHAKTYFDQAGKILDLSPEKLEVRRNSEWLAKLSFADVIRLASRMTVARMLERDTFALRFKAGDPIGCHELLYPLMQGYDSVMVHADLELGGTDQTFNNLVGRDLQRDEGQRPQMVLTMPILRGLDGFQKMSKSKDNYIGVTESPNEMFGMLMSIPDMLMEEYDNLLADRGMWNWYAKEAGIIMRALEKGESRKLLGPRDKKAKLASIIVEQFNGADAARKAEEEFNRVFVEGLVPSDPPDMQLKASEVGGSEGIWIAQLIVRCGFAKSTSEAMRLVKQGAVSINDDPVTDERGKVKPEWGQILRVGKRRFARLLVDYQS